MRARSPRRAVRSPRAKPDRAAAGPGAERVRLAQQEAPPQFSPPRVDALVAREAGIQLDRKRMATQRRRYRERLPPERVLERPLGDLLPRGIELGHSEVGELAPLLAWHLHLDHRRRGPIGHRDGDAFGRRAAARDPPIGPIESRASSRNGAPLGSYRMALAVCCPESASVTVATRVAPAGATRRKYRRTWPGPTERRSSNNGLSERLYGTVTTLTSRNNGPARASLGFHAVTVPTYTPGAASAGAE